MAPPMILGVAALALTAVGTGVSMMGQMSAAKGQQQMAGYNAQVAAAQAEAQRRAGDLNAERIREKGRSVIAQQEALYGASGVDQEGSPLLVESDTAFQNARDALVAKYNAQFAASLSDSTAQMYNMKGDAIGSALPFAEGTTLLTGADKMADIAYKNNLFGKGW